MQEILVTSVAPIFIPVGPAPGKQENISDLCDSDTRLVAQRLKVETLTPHSLPRWCWMPIINEHQLIRVLQLQPQQATQS